MLRSLSRLPLRRCMQTTARQAQQIPRGNQGALVLVGTAAAGAYLAWRTTSGANNVALDAEETTARRPLSTKAVSSGPTITPASSQKPRSKAPAQPTASEPAVITEEFVAEETMTPSDSSSASTAPDTTAEEAQGESPSSGGAYNPETGEINWDCPCLGGMAHGPCGQQFRDAFSCFVFSEEEPKGINCVEKFKAMQDCFREHPDVYGEEIMNDDDDELDAPAPAGGQDQQPEATVGSVSLSPDAAILSSSTSTGTGSP